MLYIQLVVNKKTKLLHVLLSIAMMIDLSAFSSNKTTQYTMKSKAAISLAFDLRCKSNSCLVHQYVQSSNLRRMPKDQSSQTWKTLPIFVAVVQSKHAILMVRSKQNKNSYDTLEFRLDGTRINGGKITPNSAIL